MPRAPQVPSEPLSIDCLLSPGKIYVSNVTVQQLVWLCLFLNKSYSYTWISSPTELDSACTLDLGDTVLICDCTALDRQKVPAGFVTYPSLTTIPIIVGDHLKSIVDNQYIWEVDLSFAKGTFFPCIAELYNKNSLKNKEQLLAEYSSYPSTLYYLFTHPSETLATNYAFVEESPIYSNYLEALTSSYACKKYWCSIPKSEAMRLFAGSKTFLDYVSTTGETGRCLGLKPLLQPFVRAFVRSYFNPYYIQVFGRWVNQAHQSARQDNRAAVCRFGAGYFCNFSARSLKRWSDLVRSFK